MRFITGLILTTLLASILHYFLPWIWWSALIPAIILGFALQMKSIISFLCGFIAIGGFWLGMAYWTNVNNEAVLLKKMSTVLPFGSENATLIGVALLGGILGGLAMLSAKYLRDIVSGPAASSKSKNRGKYK